FLQLISVGASLAGIRRAIGTCQHSNDCSSPASCCRDNTGHALVDQQGGFGPFRPGLGSQSSGTCSSDVGKEGDVCDYACKCGAGLECYRPVSGVCCPPMKCYNATWVHHQKTYWSNCMSDPKCFLPP
ncbi:hypothetical protein FSP39_011189, partial [Pinctada imbricata]